MLRELFTMCVAISVAAAQSVFFIRVMHNTDRTSWPQPELFEQPCRFPNDDTTTAVVVCALAHVPRIIVTAYQHDLVRLLGSFQLRDHVGRLSIGQELRFHLET